MMLRMTICAAAVAMTAIASSAAELNPAAVAYKLPDKIDWKSPPTNAGVQQAIMVGDHRSAYGRQNLQLAVHDVPRQDRLQDANAMAGRLHGHVRDRRHDRRSL